MPEIKVKHVVSCSTEDPTHKADNLLSSDTYRKWKAARAGEKQTSVILQFEKEEQVHSIDIGNEGSAFIEVLVGNSSAREQDYQVLLVMSSFMSPTESRGGTNLNRVRFFGPGQLQKSPAQDKWDRVKLVCTQPYSKNIAYGLSFVKFHSPPDKDQPAPAASPKLTQLGQFKVKEESPSSGSNLQPGSLFFRTKTSPTPKVSPKNDRLSYATATLSGSSAPSSGPGSAPSAASPQVTPTQPPAKRKFEFSKERQSSAGPPPSKKNSPPAASPEGRAAAAAAPAAAAPKRSPAARAPLKSPEQQQSGPRSEPKPKAPRASAPSVPLKRLMEGVVFVLSGFQNPNRAQLRDQALEMGAKYRPDWSPDATHLICAFANTPKYSQVRSAGGIIVRKEWVMDCYRKKEKLSYKRYLMDGAESSSGSEEEEDDEDQSEEETNTKPPQKRERQVTPRKTPQKTRALDHDDEEEDKYAGSTDLDEPGADDDDESAVDTEDELQRVETGNRQKQLQTEQDVSDPYGGSTDENTDAEAEEDRPIPELPDFLKGKRFFLYGKFPNNERRLLLRYIVAFNGVMEDYMTEQVQFVVTSEGWHDSL